MNQATKQALDLFDTLTAKEQIFIQSIIEQIPTLRDGRTTRQCQQTNKPCSGEDRGNEKHPGGIEG